MADYVWALEYSVNDEFNGINSEYNSIHATREGALAQLAYNIRETAPPGIINLHNASVDEAAVMDELLNAGVPEWDVEEFCNGLELQAAGIYENGARMCGNFIQPEYDDAVVVFAIRRELVRANGFVC